MARLTQGLLWLFVFSVPWENLSLPWVGRLTIVLGVTAAVSGVLAAAVRGRLRKPGSILWLSVAFAFIAALSSLWTISPERTTQVAFTYVQLVVLVWLIWEFVETPKQLEGLLFAYCLGMIVPLVDVLLRYNAGIRVSYDPRYTAAGQNANDLGLACALTIPLAVSLVAKGRGVARLVAGVCLALSPVALMLTGGRGPFLAGIVALTIVPLTAARLRQRTALALVALLVACAAGTAALVPATSWARIQTIVREFNLLAANRSAAYGEEGTLSGRLNIWVAGWQVFQSRPVLGVGAGAFDAAVDPLLERQESRAAHSVPVAVLVEQGIVGFAVFAAVFGACGWVAWNLPRPEQSLWVVLLLTWLVGVMSLSWQYQKLTWLLFALVAAQGHLRGVGPHPAASGRPGFDGLSSERILPAYRQRAGQHSST